jgi:hypothetical protein
MIDTIEHNAPLGNSDHETLEFNFRFGIKQKKHYQNKLCWFKGNYAYFIFLILELVNISRISSMHSISILFGLTTG